MRLEQLRQLVEISRLHSISRAAELQHISQPALSASLKSLEEELGRELFKRTNRGILLTGDGEKICRDAEHVLGVIDGWHADADEGRLAGEVHVSCSLAVSHHLTPNIIAPFQALHPGVTVFVTSTNHQNLLESLRNSLSNIAIASLAAGTSILEEAQEMNLAIHPLFTDERRLYMGRRHPLADREELSVDDLATLTLAWYSDFKDVVSRSYAQYFASSYRLANKEDILDTVIRGEAVFIQPYRLFRHDFRVREGLLAAKRLPPLDISPRAEIVAMFRRDLSERERVFGEYLLEHFTDALQED